MLPPAGTHIFPALPALYGYLFCDDRLYCPSASRIQRKPPALRCVYRRHRRRRILHHLYAELLHRRHRLYHHVRQSIKAPSLGGEDRFLSDVGIILAGGLIFRDVDGIIYGMIVNYLFALVVDKLMYGVNAGKLALVVTDHAHLITDTIEECCGRGSTILSGMGGYKKMRNPWSCAPATINRCIMCRKR